MTFTDPKGTYVFEVAERTRAYVQDLQKENERLRNLVLEGETQKARLIEETRDLRARLDAYLGVSSPPNVERVTELADENKRYAERYAVLERKNAQLANLYVASYRLHETLARREVLDIIQEIVVNLVGCEQHGIYELTDDRARLTLLAGMGIDRSRCDEIVLGDNPMERALFDGSVFVAGKSPQHIDSHPYAVSACIPLRLAGQTTGAIALYELLPQKAELGDVDFELFDLLAVHAGMALYTAKLHERLHKEG